jgi:pimeloyl-ACP methyl ester carboxylesterase
VSRNVVRWIIALAGLLAVALAAAYLAICAYVMLAVTKPERRPFTRFPEQYGLAYQPVSFPSQIDHLALDGWLLPAATGAPAKCPVVVVHGRGSDRQREAQATELSAPAEGRTLEIAAHLVAQGHAVLLFDLRGSGRSGGERFTLGVKEVRDVRGAVDWLERRGLTPDGVALLGYSMGASASLMAAGGDPRVRAVVDDSGYAALGEILDRHVPRETGLPAFFTPGVVFAGRPLLGVDAYTVRPVDAVPALRARGARLLVIHGDADAVIPQRHGRLIAAAYGPGAQTWWVSGAPHVGSYVRQPGDYLARLTTFLD